MKNGPGLKMYFPIEHGDIPASYVSLSEGKFLGVCFIWVNLGIFDVMDTKILRPIQSTSFFFTR